jgi:diguanylate cyclase (GGDEF)-like protein
VKTWLNNLSIGKRVAIIVCLAFVAIILTQIVGLIGIRQLAAEFDHGYEAITQPLKAVANARGEFNAMRTALHNLAHDFNTGEQNHRFAEEIMQSLDNYESGIREYREILDRHGTGDPYEREAVDYLYEQLPALREFVEFIIPLAQLTGYEADAVRILRGDFLAAAQEVSNELAILTEILENQSSYANTHAKSLHERSTVIFISVMTISVVILSVSAYVLARSVVKPLREMSEVALNLSMGKTENFDISYTSKDELGVLADSFRNLLSRLHFDVLTGIYNRRYLDETLNNTFKCMKRGGGGSLGVLMLDIDFFKAYNDAYGHTCGDSCLRIVAKTIESSISRDEDFAARYGGEEFAVVLPNVDEKGAQIIARRIIENVNARNVPHESSSIAPHITLSIGVITGEVSDAKSALEFVELADEALYLSKKQGRNRYTYLEFAPNKKELPVG